MNHFEGIEEVGFINLSKLRNLERGDRIRVKDGHVYEVKKVLSVKGTGREKTQTYLFERVDGPGVDGSGGILTEIETRSINWPMDTKVRRLYN